MSNVKIYLLLGLVVVLMVFGLILSFKCARLENEVMKFVSRGGLKLQKALKYFNLDITNYTILDIGASTGGFTDCALQNNALKVYSLDVGTDQLHDSLRNNDKVVCLWN